MKAIKFSVDPSQTSCLSQTALNIFSQLKIALVKPDYLNDLWIAGTNAPLCHLAASTIMRTGPLALFEISDCDFYIVKSSEYFNKSFYYSQSSIHHKRALERAQLPIAVRTPEVQLCHSDFACCASSVDWSTYDIVFCIDDSIPQSLRDHATRVNGTTFICIPSEGNIPNHSFGYHAATTHNISKGCTSHGFLVDMPYTFLTSCTLESLIRTEGNSSQTFKHHVYIEPNTAHNTDQLYARYPFILHELERHNLEPTFISRDYWQNILNLNQSLFFLKLSGRPIRGSSIIEAISAGCPVLINPELLVDDFSLPEHSYLYNSQSFSGLFPTSVQQAPCLNLLSEQRKYLHTFGLIYPLIQILRTAQRVKESSATKSSLLQSFLQAINLFCYKRGSLLTTLHSGRKWT